MKKKLPWILIYAPLFFVCVQFARSNMSQWDMTGHFIGAKNFAESIWPNWVGWNPNQFSGYPQGYFYPSLFHWVIGAFSKIFSIEFSFKAMVIASTLSLPLAYRRLAISLFPQDPKKVLNFVLGAMFLYFIPKGPIGGDLYSTFRIGLVNQNWAMNFLLLFLAEHWKTKTEKTNTIQAGFWLGITILSHAIVGLAALIFLLVPFDFKRITKTSIVAFMVSAGWAIPYLLYRNYANGLGINFFSSYISLTDDILVTVLTLTAILTLVLLAIKNYRSYSLKDRCVQGFIALCLVVIIVETSYLVPSLDPAHAAAIHFYRLQGLIVFLGAIPLFYKIDQIVNKSYRIVIQTLATLICFVSAYHCFGSLNNDYNLGFRFTDQSRVLVYQGTDSYLSMVSPHQLSNLLQKEGVKTLNGLFAESSRQSRYYQATLNELFSRPMVWGIEPMPYSPRLAARHLQSLGVDGIVSLEKLNPYMKRLLPLKAQQEGVKSEVYYGDEAKTESFSAYLFENRLVEPIKKYRFVQNNWSTELYQWWMSEEPDELIFNAQSVTVKPIENESTFNSPSANPQYKRIASDEIEVNTLSDHVAWYLVKESHFPNWKAYSETGDALPLVETAPNLMAVQGRGKFRLKFELTLAEKIGQVLTWLSLSVGLILILIKRIRPALIPFLCLTTLMHSPQSHADSTVVVSEKDLLQDQIVVGSYHTCKLLNHQVYCWGINHFGQLGLGNIKSKDLSTLSSSWPDDLIDGAAGLSYTCLHNQTQVHCAGRIGKFNSLKPALLFESNKKIKKISGSHLAVCILFENQGDSPVCFGRLENSGFENLVFPSQVTDISVGANQLCVVSKNEIQCLDSKNSKREWVKIKFEGRTDSWVQLSSGAKHSCAIRSQGSAHPLYCWGDHRFSQTAQSPDEASSDPHRVEATGVQSWKMVASGDSHTCAADQNGVVFCFGDNSKSQSAPLNRSWEFKVIPQPKSVPGLKNVKGLKAKGLSTCAQIDRLYSCWGAIGNGIKTN